MQNSILDYTDLDFEQNGLLHSLGVLHSVMSLVFITFLAEKSQSYSCPLEPQCSKITSQHSGCPAGGSEEERETERLGRQAVVPSHAYHTQLVDGMSSSHLG